MSRITHLLKKPTTIVLLLALLLVGYWYFFGRNTEGAAEYDFVTVVRGDLVQEVNVTGRVKSAQELNLAFEKGGRVSAVLAGVGDEVFKGQTLVRLENGDIAAQLAQARAGVKTQQAVLDELLRGTREEEILVQEVKVQNAKVLLGEAKQNLVNVLDDAYTKSDDAVRNRADLVINNPQSSSPKVTIFVPNSQLQTNIEAARPGVEVTLVLWQIELQSLSVKSDLAEYAKIARRNLDTIKSFLDDVALAINTTKENTEFSQATLDGFKTDISTARTNVNTGISNLAKAEEKLTTAQSSLSLAEQELVLDKAGATEEEISAQAAKVEEAAASVRNYIAQIEKTIIRAPINGVITKQDAKPGEIVGANTVVTFLVSTADFEVDANVPEADIAKIKLGDPASFTLDAYTRDEVFSAEALSIDPAETIIDGVSTYKVTFSFADEEGLARSGMTADVDVITATRENVIAIPARAVISDDGGKFVRVIGSNGSIEKRRVQTGIRGTGSIEIVDGINEGDNVIIFLQEE